MKSPIVAICISLLWGSSSSLPSAMAQGIGDSLIVNLKSGQRVAIPLADIQKITFDSTEASAVWGSASSLPTHQTSVNFPNPLRTSTTIEFTLPDPGSATIAIFDAKGNLIRTLDVGHASRLPASLPAGLNRITWDGLDDRSTPVPTGDYFYEVRFKGETQTRRMVVIK